MGSSTNSKWIVVADTDRRVTKFAAEIIELRMQVVTKMLPLAAYEYREDVEHVHQLRVGCRRAGAALQAFRPLLTGKSKRLRKWLQRIRRAAGPARDADVLLARMKAEPKTAPAHKYVVARLKKQRTNVQDALVAVAKKADSGKLDTSIEDCLKALQKRSAKKPTVSFDVFAHQAFRSASQQLFQKASIQQPTVEQLHQLRIAGKKLRYSIELFHSAFPTALVDEVYPLIEKIQSQLGQINDHVTAQSLFQSWLADLPPNERAALLAARVVEEHELTENLRGGFLDWWTAKRVATLESRLSEFMH